MNYTHEVFSPLTKNKEIEYYYHQPTKSVYDLEHKLVNDRWEVVNNRYWDIRPIIINLENE